MNNSQRYSFTTTNPELGEAGFRPYLPLTLIYQQTSITVSGLLDTGATVNVLPYAIGQELGYDWDAQQIAVDLTGNLAQYEARVILLDAIVSSFNPQQLVFAWTKATNIPLILGQVNFFMMFDVCFYRSRLQFEVSLKSSNLNPKPSI
jgi:hypothetical protein